MKISSSITVLLVLSLLGGAWAEANDSAVETSVGGLKLRRERSVSMEKENLFISPNLVVVEYEFRNKAKTLVSSQVAFPIPSYRYKFDDAGGNRGFADFKVWIDGKPVKVEKEVRAFVKSREVSSDLRRAGITIETFGNFDPRSAKNEIFDLAPDVRKRLVKVGALKAPSKKDNALDFWPEWETHVKYHWRQEFPPGTLVRIKHEYKPVKGFSPVQVQEFEDEFADACISAEAFREVKRRVAAKMERAPLSNNYFEAMWVSYILTTANTWKTPIKDFQLVVQGQKDDIVTFCWDGTIEKTSEERLSVRKTDFVPKKELKVYFLGGFNSSEDDIPEPVGAPNRP